MTTNYDKIKTRIAALIAKAKGTDNEHEAAAFIAKAEELLEQYQIDAAELGDDGDVVRQHNGLFADGKQVKTWHLAVYRQLGLYYGCKSIRVDTHLGPRQELVGRESAIVTTDLMFAFIKDECNRLGNELRRAGGASNRDNGARLVGNALALRIAKLIRKRDALNANAPTTQAAKNSLLVLDQVTALYEQLYPDRRKLAGRTLNTSASARDLASTIGLSREVHSGSAALQIGGR